MGDSFIISGLKDKRASVAGRIVELRREADLPLVLAQRMRMKAASAS
jgi:hypothetical protein